MGIRLIALDLDNTTLYDAATLTRENREAIEDAIAEGCQVAIASGRVLSTLPASVVSIPGIRYAITSNGAAIYKFPEWSGDVEKRMAGVRQLRVLKLPADRVLAVMKLVEEYPSETYPVSFEFFIDGQAYGYADYVRDPLRYGASPAYVEYVQRTRIMVEDVRSFILEHKDQLDGLDLQVGDMQVDGRPLVEVLRERLSGEVMDIYMTSSVGHRIEISHADSGKASGIRYLMNILGIGKKETAAFGDADNDADMLRAAGVGIAVRNASANCKAAADQVTRHSKKNGVAYGIHHFLGFADRRGIKEGYMRQAMREAKRAEKLDEVPIGCVIVKDGQVIARGYNRRNTDRNTLSHAEVNAIRKASRKLGDWRLDGCTMYVTLEPCQMCAGAIVQSRIDKVVIGTMSPKTGCAGSVINLMRIPQFNHMVDIESGILDQECSQMLSDYFVNLRERKKKQ